MKKLLYIIFGVMGALMFIQCSDWSEMDWAVSSFASESRVKIGVLVVSFGIIVSPFKL